MVACLCLAAVAHAQDAPLRRLAAVTPLENYQLGTGDKLRVIVYGEDDLGGAFDVDSEGSVSLPMIGETKVVGLTVSQLERTIAAKLADGYVLDPRVNVEIVQYRPFYVIGEVNKPGEYPYVSEMNVLNAVALAGGFTVKAIEGGAYVRRYGQTGEVYVPADSASKIYPGDIVRIKSSPFWDVLTAAGPLAGFASLAALGGL